MLSINIAELILDFRRNASVSLESGSSVQGLFY
jgi:hypothetical protein